MILQILECGPVSAQEGLQCGFTAGIQNTMLRSTYRSEIDAKNAFCPLLSADMAYGIYSMVAIQSGIGYALYSQNTSKFRNNFSYLTIPLYLRLGGFRNNRRFAFSLFGGPNYKFLISASNAFQNERNNISDYTTRFHLDYTIGAGLKYKVNEVLALEVHLTTTLPGGSFNIASADGFILKNFNYGAVFGFKYHFW